jgi:hypothetical protein
MDIDYEILFFITEKYKKITSLTIDGFSIGNNGVEQIKRCNISCIKHLNLRKNNIGHEGIKILA